MSTHKTQAIRDFALVGGSGAGKTSLAESILAECKAVGRKGSVDEGTTVSDYRAEEKEKGHSISLSVLNADRGEVHFNVVDSPGYPDFVGEAAAAMGACETAVLVVSATAGLSFHARKIWELAGQTGRARCVVVTHIDDDDVDYAGFVEELGESLGARCLPVAYPADGGVELVPFGGDASGDAAAMREALIEAVVEVDEDAMLAFLEEDKPPSEEEAVELLKRSMISGDVVPVLSVQAVDGTGVGALLDFAARCFPSPLDGPMFKDAEGNDVTPDGADATAFVFKTVIDSYVGKICMLRLVSGSIEPGATLQNARTEKNERLAHLQCLQGKDHKDVEGVVAGDLFAVTKIDDLETSDTLRAGGETVYAPLTTPKPMVARALESVNKGDEAKVAEALRKVAVEDPTFVYERDEATGELVVHGVSLMHVETMVRRMKDSYGAEVELKIPRVPLKETCTAKAEGHYRHKKQTGGRGQFAEVYLWVQPAERGAGLQFMDDTVGGSIPRQYLPAVEKGVREEMTKGVLAGYRIEDVEVHVTDGKHHDVDSDEASFKLAGARAFRDAFQKSKPVLLEPLLDIEVAMPVRFMGAITSDLNGRRAQIQGMDSLGDTQVVRARVPQMELLTYPTALRSLTAGEGGYTAEFHDYEIMPSNVQAEVAAAYKPKDED